MSQSKSSRRTLYLQRQSLQSSSLLSRNEGVEHLLRPQQRESTSLDQEIQIHEDWWAKQRQSTSLDQEIQTHEDWWAKQQRESSEQGSWRPQKQTRRTGDVPWKLPRLPFMGSTSTTDIEAKSQLDPKDTRAQLPPKTSLTTAQTVSPPVASAVKRWSQVVASFWPYMNSWGLLNSFGVFQAYYTAVRLPSESASKISLIGSMQAFLLLFVGVLTGPLIDGGYMGHVLALGTFLSAFGLFMTSLCHTYWQFMLAQGVVLGIGSGCLFLPSVAVVPQWFEPKRRNLVLGIVAAGSSFGGVIFPITFHYLVPQIGFGWAVRVIAFLGLATNLPSLAVLQARVVPPTRRAIVDLSMFKDTSYLSFCLSLFVCFLGLYAPIFYISPYATQTTTIPATVAFYLVPILMLGSGPGRVVPNLIADKIGSLNVFIPAAFISSLLAFCWIAISSVGGLVVFAALYGMSSGAVVSILPPAVVAIAPDMKNIGTRMGMAFAVASVGLLIGNPIAGALLKNKSYIGLQAFSASCLLGCTVLLVWVRFVKVGWKLLVKV